MWICEPYITHPWLADFSNWLRNPVNRGKTSTELIRCFLIRSGFRAADPFIGTWCVSESNPIRKQVKFRVHILQAGIACVLLTTLLAAQKKTFAPANDVSFKISKTNLRCITLGWNLQSTAQDELFAVVDGTAFHTRNILHRMAEHGVHIERVINAGGIPQKKKQRTESNLCQRSGRFSCRAKAWSV